MDVGPPTAEGLTFEVALNWLGVLVLLMFVGHMVRYAQMGVELPAGKSKGKTA